MQLKCSKKRDALGYLYLTLVYVSSCKNENPSTLHQLDFHKCCCNEDEENVSPFFVMSRLSYVSSQSKQTLVTCDLKCPSHLKWLMGSIFSSARPGQLKGFFRWFPNLSLGGFKGMGNNIYIEDGILAQRWNLIRPTFELNKYKRNIGLQCCHNGLFIFLKH